MKSFALKGLFYWALVTFVSVPPIFIIALIALDVARICGQRRVAV